MRVCVLHGIPVCVHTCALCMSLTAVSHAPHIFSGAIARQHFLIPLLTLGTHV